MSDPGVVTEPEVIRIEEISDAIAPGPELRGFHPLVELGWSLIIAALPLIMDLLKQGLTNQEVQPHLDYSAAAFSAFALSAAGVVRSIQNRQGMEYLFILVPAMVLQIVAAVWTTGASDELSAFLWSFLGLTVAVSLVGIGITWWPGLKTIRAAGRAT